MKYKKKLALVLSLVTALLVSVFPFQSVQAGDNSVVLDSSTLEDKKLWSNLSDDVAVKNGKLVFPKESDQYTRFISMREAQFSEGLATLAKAEFTIKFTQLPEGEKFIFAFGLKSMESGIGEVGNIEVTFTNDGGIKASVLSYGEDGNAVTVCEPQACGIALNRNASIKAEVKADKTLTLSVNGKTICSGTLSVNGAGRAGFVQTKSCGAEVSGLKIYLARYERPENANVSEDFENGFDTSVLTAKAIYTYSSGLDVRGAGIKDYNGSKVFMMENMGWSYIATLYDYSNFEMTFDVPYLLTHTITDDKGNLEYIDTGAFVVCFGNAQTDCLRPNYEDSAETLYWERDSLYSAFNREEHTVKHKYWQSERGFSIQVKVVDKHLTVGMKWIDEAKFETLMEYDLGTTSSLGKIHFWIPERANMAIDNLIIKNLDENPNLIETEFKSGKVTYKDYDYKPFERVYKEKEDATTDKKDSVNVWYWSIPAALVLGGIAIAVTAVLTNKKGGKTNEN